MKCTITPVLTPKQVAEIFQVSIQTVKNWCREGKIEAFKLPSGDWRVRADICNKIMEGND